MLTSKQRAYLRGLAQQLDTIFQVGKGGITEEMCISVSAALESRELIKLRVLENSGYSSKEAAEKLADACSAYVVAVVGNRFVLYRESQNKKRIELPKAR